MAHDQFLKKVAEFLLSEEKMSNPLIARARAETCQHCPKIDKQQQKCTVCGCYIETKSKLMTSKNPLKLGRIEITHCPLGFWGDKVIANLYREIDGNKTF